MSILGVRSLLWTVKEIMLLAINQAVEAYRKDRQMDRKEVTVTSGGTLEVVVGTAEDYKDSVVFMTGPGWAPGAGEPIAGSFIFRLGDKAQTEVLRIDPDGSFFVMGRKVDTDQEVYAGFREWIQMARVHGERG